MNLHTAQTKTRGHERSDSYRRSSLVELAELIVNHSDALALREFHEHRKPFGNTRQQPLRFVEFVGALRESALAAAWARGNTLTIDRAYDLTSDKFSRLPQASQTDRDGPDCRRYFKAFLDHADKRLRAQPVASQLEQDSTAATTLQGLVTRHFYLSCLEHNRGSNRFIRRYFWRVDGGTICVWLPSHMTGHQCRRWLEANIPDVDPARSGENDRVQSIINKKLVLPRVFSHAGFDGRASSGPSPQLSSSSMPPEVFSVKGLAGVVAEEKAENINQQRPTIRALGKLPLQGLIRRIFEDLSLGQYQLGAVAAAFGLSKATLSRFAGARWAQRTENDGAVVIPDLWRNTAAILAGHPDFAEAARSAGVWPRVESVIARHTGGKRP